MRLQVREAHLGVGTFISRVVGQVQWLLSPTKYLAVINVLSSALGFMQGILVARHLGPDSYGVIAVIAATNVTVLNLLDVRLADLAGKLYYRPSQASISELRTYRASVLQVCLVGNGLISLGLCVLGFLANLVLIRTLTTTPVRVQWLLAQSLILALSNWASSFDYLQRFSGRFYLMGTWRLVTRLVSVGLFLAVFLPSSNLDSYYRALLSASGLGLVMTALISALIWLKYERLPMLRQRLLLAWPDYRRESRFLFFGNLLGYIKMLHRGSDVLLVGFFAGDRLTGLYKLARSLTDVLYIFFDALNQVYYPRFMELLAQRTVAEYRRLASRLLVASGGFTLLVLVVQALLLAPVLQFVLANRFAGAEGAIMVMTVPFLFVAGIYTWLWPLFVHSGKLERYTVYSFLACFVQYGMALILFVVTEPTPLAAALGYLAYYCVLFPMAYRVAQRDYAAYLPGITGISGKDSPGMHVTKPEHEIVSHFNQSTGGRPLHIVQIGCDDTVFRSAAPSNTLNRQLNYGRELARQRPGSRMSVIMYTTDAAARRFERENVAFIPVMASRLRRLPKLYSQLSALHRAQPLDVIATQSIHSEAWMAVLFGKFHDVNVVGQIHYDLFSRDARRDLLGRGPYGWLNYVLSLQLMHCMVAVRVVGRRVQEHLLSAGLHRNVHLVPVPVTMDIATIASHLPSPAHRVLFVGRLVPAKNVGEWLQVAQRVAAQDTEVTCKIVGEGPLSGELEMETKRLGLKRRVHFAGAVAYDQLPQIYRSAKVFLLTSKYEGFGRVVVEAYLSGVPVVATQITGVEDIVEDGQTGFLHAPGDVRGMADSVLRLLHDDALRQRMGQRGRDLVRARFDPERLSREWVSLLISAAREA